VEGLSVNVEFLHKDEFMKKYNKKGKFPSAYIKNEGLKLFISQEEMNKLRNLDELIALVKENLSNS